MLRASSDCELVRLPFLVMLLGALVMPKPYHDFACPGHRLPILKLIFVRRGRPSPRFSQPKAVLRYPF